MERNHQPLRCKYFGGCANPPDGTTGLAWEASGHFDSESAEHLAWMFQPDSEPDAAYYCTFAELLQIS